MSGYAYRLFAAAPLLWAGGHLMRRGRRTRAPGAGAEAAPPSVRYEAHLSAGGVPPAGAELTNPHRGDERTTTRPSRPEPDCSPR